MMIRPILIALAALFCLSSSALALDLDQMNDTERAAFRAEIRAYLLENPEVIMEAVAVLDQRRAAQDAENDQLLVKANIEALFEDGHSWVGGNPEGDITLVEFMDYQCGYCRKAFDEVHELVSSDGNIRFIVKEFPILGPQSTLSSRFAVATKLLEGDDAYEAIHTALMTYNGEINEAALARLAEPLGLEAAKILAHMDSEEVSQILAANRALGQQMGISGTPSFVMQDQMLRGYVPLNGMRQIVEEIRTQ
jgi:protein-disulfide isomerase